MKKIYDCLNIGCNKKAVQEVDRLPKNARDMTVFKALKALALIRMSKMQQASDILKEINPEDDLDEVTLQTMTSCYKESTDVSKIVDLYEAASRRKPDDTEIMAHLFMAHVRVFNYKRQKEIALQMYKIFGKKKRLYSFWAIMSLVMQAEYQEGGLDQNKVILSLAEKMCEKMIDDERSHEEIELYLMILRRQNKHEEEYKFLTGPTCLRITDHLSWFNRRRAYLCFDLKMYSRAFKHYFPTLIQEYPDQIEYYEGLFESALVLETEAQSQQQPVVAASATTPTTTGDQPTQSSGGTPVKSTSALAECFEIVEKQCSAALEPLNGKKNTNESKSLSRTTSLDPSRKRFLRGPFIARLELYNTILNNEKKLPQNVYNLCLNQFKANFPTLSSLYFDYFQAFSNKVICYHDMEYIFEKYKTPNLVKEELIKMSTEWMQAKLKLEPSPNEYDMFHTCMVLDMLKHSMQNYRPSDSKESRLSLAKTFIDTYDSTRQLSKNTNKTEFQPFDNYCLLAVNSVMINAIELKDLTSQAILSDSVLISLIVMMEQAIVNSPSNHQLKLCLLKLYSFIGASKQCSNLLQLLDIKHFQIDTLGHLLNPVLYNTGHYNSSKESLETCLEFYSHGTRECIDGLTTSYKDGRFSKIEEINSVLRRLTNSLNAAQCVLLKSIVTNLGASNTEELISAGQTFDSDKWLERVFNGKEPADTVRDSRDFKVLKSFHSETNNLIKVRQAENLADEQLWLRLRFHVMRSIRLQSSKALGKGKNVSVNKEQMAKERAEIESLLEKIESVMANEVTDQRYSYLEPESSPFRWAHIDFKLLVSLVYPLATIDNPKDLDQAKVDAFASNLDKLMTALESQLGSTSSLVRMKQSLLSLTLTVEFISLCGSSLLALVHLDQVASGQAAAKTKSVPNQMLNKTEAQLTKLANLIKSMDARRPLDTVTTIETTLLSDPKHSRMESKAGPQYPLLNCDIAQQLLTKVKEKIFEGYVESLKEIEATCRRKAKLFRPTN